MEFVIFSKQISSIASGWEYLLIDNIHIHLLGDIIWKKKKQTFLLASQLHKKYSTEECLFEFFENMKGIEVIIDDILIHGKIM